MHVGFTSYLYVTDSNINGRYYDYIGLLSISWYSNSTFLRSHIILLKCALQCRKKTEYALLFYCT